MKIAVIGGGNIGTLMAAEAAHKGHEVMVYTSRPEQWKKEIEVYNVEDRRLFSGYLSAVTNSMQKALEFAEYIWITMPAQMFEDLASQMLPYVHKGQKIGIIPGSGGAEFAFHKLILQGCTLFGLQRVHSIARLKEYGKMVYELGRKSSLQIGAIPARMTAEICAVMEAIFDVPCETLDNYLAVTLTPSNPILHTTRLYSMFKDYREGVFYSKNILFYEEWSEEASEWLIACDRELQGLCRTIPLNLVSVMSLCDYYESPSVDAMTKKIRSIKAFKGLTSPMRKVKGGWIPDWESRYFMTDFPYGLKIIKDMASMFSVETPNIDIVWKWYEDTAMQRGVVPFNINLNIEQFIQLYKYE